MKLFSNICKLLFTKHQCENGVEIGKGGRVYCVRKNGHFGKCKSYNGKILTRMGCVKQYPIKE